MLTGGCLCGRVRFEIGGRLTPIQICHAKRCQKATGGPFAAEVAARASTFRFTAGEEFIQTWDAPLLREPPAYRRAFCRVCGSPVPVLREGTSFVGLHPGVLDGDSGTHAAQHIFLSNKADWYQVNDDLEKFDERPPMERRLRGATAPRPAPRT